MTTEKLKPCLELQDFDVIIWEQFQGMSVVRILDGSPMVIGSDSVEWVRCSYPRNAEEVYREMKFHIVI